MKTVDIEHLPEETRRMIHEAVVEEIVLTEKGHPLALLKGLQMNQGRQQYWEERQRKLASLPKLDTDSTEYISEDRG